MTRLDTSSIVAFLRDPRFREILRESTREYLPWERLLEMPLPDGLSAVDTWDILGTFRRIDAIFNPITDINGKVFWYVPTQRVNASVSRIAEACREDSPLHLGLSNPANKQSVIHSRIVESVACARLDGYVIPLTETLRILGLDRAPRTSAERLAANSLAIQAGMDAYLGEPLSPAMLREFHDRLLEGVEIEKLEPAERRRGVGTENYDPDRLAAMAETQMQKTCDYANGVGVDDFDHPVVRAILLRDSIRGYQPLPHFNAMVARLAFAKYVLEVGLPVLAALPLAEVALEWEDGKRVVRPFDRDVTLYSAMVPYRGIDEADITPFVTISAQLALQTLEELEEDLAAGDRRDREVLELLHGDESLNQRQRAILGEALRNPAAEFDIRHHRTQHNIAYATGRADLLGLVESGYLVQEERGQAFVFRRGPRFDELLAQ